MRTLAKQLSSGIRIGLLVVGVLVVSTSVAQTSLEEWLQLLEEELDEPEQKALAGTSDRADLRNRSCGGIR